ncbi:serine hydrolase domain-containing protein [Streptomyces sp. BH106]|uniref:serine hydrolase domain-containing protein n=1 Tax=Streptomyces sp. BH106 TaxID=3410409 RepID=UPI003CF51E0B
MPGATVTHPVGPELADYLQSSRTDAFLVLSDGELSTEWYAPGVRSDDRHMIFSCTKSVVGLVAEALIAEGSLDEKAQVDTYLPEVAQGGYAGVTVRDVLDMTANVAFTEDYDGPDVRAFRIACGQVESPDSEGIHAYTAARPAAGEHGRATRYVSPTADLAGWLCERVAGQSLAGLVSAYVWEPMGAELEGDLLLDGFGGARASGGLCAGLRDMARIGQLLLREDLTGPAAAAVAAVKQPGDGRAWAAGSLADFIPGAAYRSFWYQLPHDPEVYLAAGIYGQRIYVDVPRRVVIAQQASLPESFDPRTWGETLPLFQQIAHRVTRR